MTMRARKTASPFGVALQRARRSAGLSQQELAERAGLSQRGIADLERGIRRNPYPATLRRLVEALGLEHTEREAFLAAADRCEPASHVAAVRPARSLPLLLNSLVGREHELASIRRLLQTSRLVTLTGTGGIGKTRLVLEVTRASADAVFVDLAPLTDGGLVMAAVAAALGVREQPNASLHDLLCTRLAEGNPLLVLDNCEHLVQACAELAESLLRSCPELRILATSRERLGVPGERNWPVPPLAVPDEQLPAARLPECETVRLFLERATAMCPEFAHTPRNSGSIASLCRRLDGIPLAIELAAARVNVLSVEQIAVRLDDAVRLLAGGSRTSPARHQTLQATFEWSHDLLSEPERLLLARVSVFAGGWTLEAAEAVCGSVPLEREDILDLLGQLVDKSLVLVEAGDGDVRRYRLLEPLRQFAAERLAERGATADLRQRHAHWVSALVEGAARSYHGPNEPAALDRLEREHANIQAGFDWLLDGQAQVDEAARLAGGLWWFWTLRDNWLEARSRLKRLLDASPRPGPSSQPTVLWIAGSMAWHQGDLAAAREWIDACLTATRQQAQPGLFARAVAVSGHLAAARGEYATARGAFEEGLQSSRVAGDRWAEARNLDGLATLALEKGDFGTAEDLLGKSLDLARAIDDTWSLAAVLNTLGDVARSQADYARARRLYEESLARFEDLGTALGASVLHNLGYVAIQEHEHDRAAELFGESLRMYRASGEQRGMVECLVGFACLAAADGESERAARLFAAAEATFTAIGAQLSPSNRADRARWLVAARAGLSGAAFAAASAAGSSVSLDEAIREAVGAV